MRSRRLLAFGLWISLGSPWLVGTFQAPALAAPPRVKTIRHRGAFSLSMPNSNTRLNMTVAYDPTARALTLSVPGKDLLPSRVVQVPEFEGTSVRSELLRLEHGERALVLYFGDPKPYVVVLLTPLLADLTAIHQGQETDRSQLLANAVVLKGFMNGQDASAPSLSVSEGADGQRLILSEPGAADASLCGHAARSTRALDAARGRFVRVAVPLLGAEERRGAQKLRARPDTQPGARDVYLGDLPSAFETTAHEGEALTDAALTARATPYEATHLVLPAGADVQELVVLAPEPHAAEATWDLWLWTEKAVFEVDTSDVRGAPTFAFDLPAEAREGCVAMAVGARSPIVEVRGRLPSTAPAFPSSPGEALRGPNGELAARHLALALPSVVPELARSFSSLDPSARTQAESLARLAPARDAESFWVRQLIEGNEGERIRAEARLEARADGGHGALARALRAAKAKDELPLAVALAERSPAAAVRPIAYRLTQRSAARRLELRKVLAERTADQAFLDQVSALVVDPATPRKQKVEVLRATAPAAPRLSPEAQAVIWKLVPSASFEEAYVLIPVVLAFGVQTPAARSLLLAWMSGKQLELTPRELAALRTEILSAAAAHEQRSPELSRRASALLEDPFVRVRASAAMYLENAPSSDASSALSERVRHDDWPVVREASLGALGSLRHDPERAEEAEKAMIRALGKDSVISVRGRAARELATLPKPETITALRRSLGKDESAAVRAEAARSLGLLCDAGSTAALTAAARGLARGAHDEADVRLGLNAVTALSRLAPPDLDERLAPLTAPSVPGPLRARVESAMDAGQGGCATVKKQ